MAHVDYLPTWVFQWPHFHTGKCKHNWGTGQTPWGFTKRLRFFMAQLLEITRVPLWDHILDFLSGGRVNDFVECSPQNLSGFFVVVSSILTQIFDDLCWFLRQLQWCVWWINLDLKQCSTQCWDLKSIKSVFYVIQFVIVWYPRVGSWRSFGGHFKIL